MAFLPIFLIGVLLGIGVRWAYDQFRENTPSETRLHMQEITIGNLRADIQLLNKQIVIYQTELDEYKKREGEQSGITKKSNN